MKMKIKLMALAAGLLAVLPMTSAWAGDTTYTYYASLKTVVSSGSTGMGKVYATTTADVSDYSKFSDTSSQMDSMGSSTESSASVSLYAHALANEGFEFSHWSKTDNGTSASTDNPYSCSQSSSQKDQNVAKASPTIVYAVFKEVEMTTPYDITFLRPESGSYTYSGTVGYSGDKGTIAATTVSAADAEVSGLKWTTNLKLKAIPASEMKILGWYTVDANGVKQPYFSDKEEVDFKAMSATRIGVDFAPDCVAMRAGATTGTSVYKDASVDLATMVAEAAADTTGKGLVIFKDVALADDLEIPFGVSVTVQPGATLTIAGGKTIAAKGMLINNGAITGGSIAHSYITVVQGKDVRVPWPDGTDGLEGATAGTFLTDGTSGKYLVTSLKNEDSLSGSGTYDGDASKVFATIDNQASGEKFASKISTTKPKAVLCTVAREKAANWINGVVELGATVTQGDDKAKEVYTTFGYALEACGYSGYSDNDKMIVLLQDVTDGYKNKTDGSHTTKSSGGLNASQPRGAVDCAGKKLTITSGGDKVNGGALVKCFNGAMTMSTKILTQKMMFFNCSGSIKICGSSYVCGYCFYDSPSMSVSYESSYKPASTSNDNTLNFYAGDYCTSPYTIDLYTATKSTYAVVYSGTYKNDPSKNVYNSNKVEARQDPSTKCWTIFKLGGTSEAQVEVNGVECSLGQALVNASDSGVTVIKVKQDVEITEDVVIGAGKDIQLNTSGWTIAGTAKIVNNGNLEIIDLSGNIGDERSKVNLPIENNGTLLLSEAIYNGSITLKGGKCYFIDGQFNGDIVVADVVADARAVAEVGGGSYAKTTYAHAGTNGSLKDLCLDRGYETGSAPNYLIANIPSSVVTYDQEKSAFTLRAFDASDKAVFAKRENRGACTKEEWILARRLLSSVEMFGKWSVDCAVVFDRDMPVAGFSVTPAIFPMPLDSDVAVAANVDYSAFLQAQRRQGYAPFRYESFLPGGEHETDFDMTLACKSANKGTSCGFELRLANGVSTQSGPKDYSYKTWVVIDTCRFVFGADNNKAMLQPASGAATFYSTLDAAVAAAETNGKTIKLCNDCSDDVTVGKPCVIDTNGFEFSGSIAPADGFEMKVADGVYTFAEAMPKGVAQIGETVYETLAKAVAAAKAGDTIKLLKDDATDVTLPEGVALNTNGRRYSGTITTTDGFKAVHSDGVWSVESVYVATNGGTGYGTLAEALAAAGTEIVIVKTSDEAVTVGKACTVTVAGGVQFLGKIVAADGFVIAKSGSVWTVSAAAAPIEVNVKVGETESKQAEVVVSSATVAKLAESEQKLTVDEIQEVVEKAVVLSTGESEQTVEVAEESKKVPVKVTDGFAAVKVTDGKSSVIAELGADAQAKDQGTGVYQQTKVVEVEGEKIAVPDVTKPAVAVIKDQTTEETVILTVPGDKDKDGNPITVANVIASGMETGDEIKVYDLATKSYLWWKYENSTWVEKAPNPTSAGSYPLAAGTAFWYTRAKGNTNPIVVVAAYQEELTTEIKDVPEKPGDEAAWNLVANANPVEAFDVNKIQSTVETSVENDKIIVPLKGLAQRTLTRKGGKWGYIGLVKQEIRPGKFSWVNAWIECGEEERKIDPGKGFWYLSNGGKPTFNWGKGDGK